MRDFANHGRTGKAKQACEESRSISRELDDKLGIARADTILGTIQYDKSDLEGAKRLYQEALDNAQLIGAQKDVSGALNNLALCWIPKASSNPPSRLTRKR